MGERGVNKDAEAIVVCIAPDVCLTPQGLMMVRVPYTITSRFNVAVETAPMVNYGKLPAFTMASRLPTVKGDERGIGGGIISGVNLGHCRPVEHSGTVRAHKQFIVRHNDLFHMNCNGPDGPGNTYGRVVYVGVDGKLPAKEVLYKSPDKVTTDEKGRTVVEQREVTRDPETGKITETHQRTVIDPKTGSVETIETSRTQDPAMGTTTYEVTEARFDPSTNNYSINQGMVSVPGDGGLASTGPVLGSDQVGQLQPDGQVYLGGGVYVDPNARPVPALDDVPKPETAIDIQPVDGARNDLPTVLPGPDQQVTPPEQAQAPVEFEEIADDDPALLSDPDYQRALEEQARAEAEIAQINEQLYWEGAETAADIAGLVDPTPASDTVAAGLALRRGDVLGAGLNLLSWVPYLGDAVAKPIKGARAAARVARLVERLRTLTARLDKLKDLLKRIKDKVRRKKAPDGGSPTPEKPGGGNDSFIPKKPVSYTIGKKIAKQMRKRGWSEKDVQDTLNKPHRTVSTRDTRHMDDGTRMNDPATAYIREDGHYVVRNDVTGDIVQVSNRNDPNWITPF